MAKIHVRTHLARFHEVAEVLAKLCGQGLQPRAFNLGCRCNYSLGYGLIGDNYLTLGQPDEAIRNAEIAKQFAA